ncbi:hypothetical protein NCAS_0D02420 [Naumovozyma castellii]|uniref:NAD-dependent epimerase/dehydratase domain-containing protein n=1 Tax=Naumovozyma castellii TaxID=27288 RepID=G0VE32_NAUCA|nr:hypothetical protein NCAS_0D02420 [Naumovozyma castellii CBS 4309]CCC69823.1 hypothetical protein NCAS_0D02420 [Naumovozyma castellii CBS 4309]
MDNTISSSLSSVPLSVNQSIHIKQTMSSQTTVFVSGASGFIALHVVNDLLNAGYKVIGSARSQEKCDQLLAKFKNHPSLSMVIVPDISDLNAFDDVFKKYGKEIKIVLHTASPFRFDVNDYEKDLLIPALNGTKSILNAIKQYAAQTVERVVITSSMAAQLNTIYMNDKSITVDETSWNDATWEGCQTDPVSAYCASKGFAEKAAWDFLKENKDQVKFKLSTVLPVYVFGPQLFPEPSKKVLNTSSEIINQIVNADKDTELMQMNGGFIDVRDVAKAHLLAFQKDECAGERLSLYGGMFSTQDFLDIINEDFPQLKGKIPVGKPGTGKDVIENSYKINNERTKKLLGFEFINKRDCVDASVQQILETEGKL